jgi:predicted PhzF superfamily epimerase YddE/YHI9
LPAARSARRSLVAGRRAGDEPVRDGVPRSARRRQLRPALVHAGRRGRSLRARDAGERAALWEDGHLRPEEEARFHTRSGLLTARRDGDWIELDFPADLPSPAEAPPELLRALDVSPIWVGRTRLDYFLELDSAQTVRALSPDFALLRTIDEVRGTILTARSDDPTFDFISRFFAPAAGVDEDPVTGSSFCPLGPYWAAKLGKDEMLAFQASARGGIARVRPAGERVRIAGQAVTVLRGELVA